MFGCQSPKRTASGVSEEDNLVLIPQEVALDQAQIEQLEQRSDSGDCEASYRLFEYYAFCTSLHWLTLHYAELSLTQGCEEAKDDLVNLKKALGIPE